MSLICIPPLQSWCIEPPGQGLIKSTRAHEYLQKNPAVLAEVLRRARQPKPVPVYSVAVARSPDDSLTPGFILDVLQKWDLTDVLDLAIGEHFEIVFRTPISAHICCKLSEFTARAVTSIPALARVPLVYVQGIGADARPDEIRSFFKTISPILNIKFVQKRGISFHILKFSSVRRALKVSETADRERFKGNLLTVSHQFKMTVTRYFFLSGPAPGALTSAAVSSEVGQIGDIDRIFVNEIGAMKEVFVSMMDLKSARLACGIMNHRIYNGEVVNAFFVDPSYFREVWDANLSM
jgi:hypothetical protein